MTFAVVFSPRARDHLEAQRKHDQQILVDAISLQLTHAPDDPTRNRKQLEDNPLAPWELRVGNFRVFYDVHRSERVVVILAIGEKVHNILKIGGEEIQL